MRLCLWQRTRRYSLLLSCPTQNSQYEEEEFSIHGFWPQNSKTDSFHHSVKKVQFSIEKYTYFTRPKYWSSDRETNADFWKHEYAKHGSCVFTPMSEYEYFKNIDLYQKAVKLNLPQKYYDPTSISLPYPITLDFQFYDDV